ncbi:unnamed protein product [Arabis nemorensis]|uniref:Uncharacterized protein n=1 Tax=Arabis nemorensis TaxID=586526 RepID=A0A565CBF4_9BRAS|nr:unnamed protein product [Arabis nemorensis]
MSPILMSCSHSESRLVPTIGLSGSGMEGRDNLSRAGLRSLELLLDSSTTATLALIDSLGGFGEGV